jgi:hypothetical protein
MHSMAFIRPKLAARLAHALFHDKYTTDEQNNHIILKTVVLSRTEITFISVRRAVTRFMKTQIDLPICHHQCTKYH